MALSLSDDLKVAIENGLGNLFDKIHSEPLATALTAQGWIRTWVENNTDYKQAWADKLSTFLLNSYDVGDTWIQFRDKSAAIPVELKQVAIRKVMNRAF